MHLIQQSCKAIFIILSVTELGSAINNAVDSQGVGLTSNFSPRMDFEQWKPLTGRGDPLRNDPTYDYEPPILERVHYWADDSRLEREHYPEHKSEILMLGVSSRKPSTSPTRPPLLSRRPLIRQTTPKYEDFVYKFNENYPMTILVPPPPPPPGQQLPLFILTENSLPSVSSEMKYLKPKLVSENSTTTPKTITYALQESNLIYQSSTTQNWIVDSNKTLPPKSNSVSTDYAGWGPTTPVDENNSNNTHNLIQTEHVKVLELPFSFYKPMLSESPPPVKVASDEIALPAFLPTALPPTESGITSTKTTWRTEQTTFETTPSYDISQEHTNKENYTLPYSTPSKTTTTKSQPGISIFDMLGPMMSMPLVNGPERPEDNLYAHATENMQIFQTHDKENTINLETMQTLQPPPPTSFQETEDKEFQHLFINNQHIGPPSTHTHDPYLHMRYTVPISTTSPSVDANEKQKLTTESPTTPMYLIIQGHSKVKTYSSKPNPANEFKNESPKPNETTEVKHLHPFKDKGFKKTSEDITKKNRSKSLRALIDRGLGSIEIQEADVGIRYDISDGSDVPAEIYKKGIVDNDENTYKRLSTFSNEIRPRRELDLDRLSSEVNISLEDMLVNYFGNDTSIYYNSKNSAEDDNQ